MKRGLGKNVQRVEAVAVDSGLEAAVVVPDVVEIAAEIVADAKVVVAVAVVVEIAAAVVAAVAGKNLPLLV
jgi:hypothetical protein